MLNDRSHSVRYLELRRKLNDLAKGERVKSGAKVIEMKTEQLDTIIYLGDRPNCEASTSDIAAHIGRDIGGASNHMTPLKAYVDSIANGTSPTQMRQNTYRLNKRGQRLASQARAILEEYFP